MTDGRTAQLNNAVLIDKTAGLGYNNNGREVQEHRAEQKQTRITAVK